jgi:Arc/MetJ-type ribon-helix-helix transcriptional regulator
MSVASHSILVTQRKNTQEGIDVSGMMMSMTREKIAITLPEEQVAAARQAVADGRAASVSAYISRALARRDADEDLAEAIAEIYADAGQPTGADRAWARRVLGLEA